MRLKQIQIYNFGQFSQETFDLPEGNLAAFFGGNEAGKSTTVAFIKQILFGFNLKNTSSVFFEDYEPLTKSYPMGGQLVFTSDAGEYVLERTWSKGDKSKTGAVKVLLNGQEVPVSLFYDQIQNIDGSFYAESFIFNEDLLRQVSSLSEGEILENIYYLGAAQSSQLLAIRADFDKEAKDLFKPSGKKAPVNQDLLKLAEQRDKVAADSQEFDAYQQLEGQRLAEEQAAKKLEKEVREISSQLSKLEKQLEQVHNYQTYLDLKKQVSPVAFDQELYQKALELNAQIKALKAAIKEEKAAVDPALLAKRKDQVRAWRQELGQISQSLEMLKQQVKQLEEKQASLLELTPHLEQVADLSMDQFQQMQADWEESQKAEAAPKTLPPYVGLIVAVIGLALIGQNRILAILLILAGAALAAYAYFKKPAKGPDKAGAFKEKYGIDASVKVDSLLAPYRDLAINRRDLANSQAELAQKEKQAADLARQLGLDGSDLTAVSQQLGRLEAQVEAESAALRASQEVKAANLNYQKQISALTEQLLAIYQTAGVENLTAYQALAQKQKALSAQITALKNNLGDQLAAFEENGLDLSKLLGQKQELEKELADKQRAVSALQQEMANLLAEEKRYASSSQVAEDKQTLAEIADSFRRDSQDYLASLLAGEVIGRTLDLASNDRFPKMLKLAQDYLEILTGGRYREILLPAKLSKKTPLKVVRKDKKKIPLAYLSRGTQEQLYFALKLAFVMQIKDKIDLPVLIDDSFVNFDGPRTGYIVDMLKKMSEDKQILVFTAREDLAEAVSAAPIRYRKKEQDA
ncbi:AAA family ATPase [Lactobacillus delbrueckii]|uniref:AAA family ATPase n=1 Tax=Lactobacillus delbrueckii TaxID=1584 RepID=UPI0022EC0B63|nr:AAA family ATPase [Lactobacillus delbrueckii]MDA3801708.1 AAA family ATPase [Lactobacillus delbrueckii]